MRGGFATVRTASEIAGAVSGLTGRAKKDILSVDLSFRGDPKFGGTIAALMQRVSHL